MALQYFVVIFLWPVYWSTLSFLIATYYNLLNQCPTGGHINCFWFFAVTKNALMNIFYMLLSTFATELLYLRKCLLKMVINTLQKQLYQFILLTPIYESAHFPKLSLTMDLTYLDHCDQFCFIYTFLNISETYFFQMLNWPLAFFLIFRLCPSTVFHICYKIFVSNVSSPFAIFLVCSTNQPPTLCHTSFSWTVSRKAGWYKTLMSVLFPMDTSGISTEYILFY